MARRYSRAKGKSSSKKPLKHIPAWTPYQGKEVEKLIVKYAKAGKTTSEIGLILRDTYGVGSVKALTGKSISAVLLENKIGRKIPEEVSTLIRKMIAIRQHLEKNKHDQTARRGLLLTNSRIHRLVRYYKESGKLPRDWVLDQERLKMYLE